MKKLPNKVFSFIIHFIARRWKIFILASLVSMMASVGNNTLWPYIVGNLIGHFTNIQSNEVALTQSFFALLAVPLGIAFIFWCFMELLQRLKGFILAFLFPRFEGDIRMEVFQHVSHHSYSYFTNKHIGAIAHRIDDLPRSAKLIVDDILTVFLPTILSIVASSYVMLTLHYVLAIVFFIWLSLYLILSVIFCHYASQYCSLQSAARAILQGSIVDSIRNYLNTKIFHAANHEVQIVKADQLAEIKKYSFSLSFMERVKILLSILNIFGILSLFYATIKLWQMRIINIGDLVFILNSTLNILTIMWFIADEMPYLFNEIGTCQQSLTVMQDRFKKREGEYYSHSHFEKDLIIKKGEIEFHNVTFGHNLHDPLFENQSVRILPKTQIGLVGLSGSGKTTFTHLIMSLHQPHAGKITIDQQDIANISLQSLRDQISFIPQETILFHRSIMDNIKYGCFHATEEEVIMAAKRAHCHEFIEQMNDKYSTVVGEMGTKLSGGQRQRIAIARAILKDAPILIMDEATSSLDSLTEKKIQQSMEYLMEDKTVIIIAHRFSTLKDVERILVFHHGMIVEDGSHDNLLARSGYYSQLWNMQQNQDRMHNHMQGGI